MTARGLFPKRFVIRKRNALSVPQTQNWDISPMAALRDFISMYRLNAKKVFSQNYIMDMNVNRKVVRKAGNIGDGMVLEIGPGPGGITRALLEQPIQRLDVIEIDERFIPPLKVLEDNSKGRMHIHHANILNIDEEQIWRDAGAERLAWYDEELPPMHVIGNLPFNVSIPLIIRYLKSMSRREGAWSFGRVPLTLTFQLEIAKRITAHINSDAWSRLSIMAQHVADAKMVFEMPGSCFVPPPKVDVGLVRFVPRIQPLIHAPYEVVEKVTRHVFMFRLRKISHGLKALYPKDLSSEMYEDLLKHSRVDPNRICLQMDMEEIGQLCTHYQKQCKEVPGLFAFTNSQPKQGLDVVKDRPNAYPPTQISKADGGNQISKEGISLIEFDQYYGA